MSVEIKIGRWRERGGGVARVVERNKQKCTYLWFGADSLGWSSLWTGEGRWLANDAQHEHDLIEYLGPLEDDK